jgi:hypothetical protein
MPPPVEAALSPCCGSKSERSLRWAVLREPSRLVTSGNPSRKARGRNVSRYQQLSAAQGLILLGLENVGASPPFRLDSTKMGPLDTSGMKSNTLAVPDGPAHLDDSRSDWLHIGSAIVSYDSVSPATVVGDASVVDYRLEAGRKHATDSHGWRVLYTRGYALDAPPEFARTWLIDHLPFQIATSIDRADRALVVLSREPFPAVRLSYPRLKLERITEWDLARSDRIIARDSLWRGKRLELLGREEHHFMGNANGSLVEVSRCLKPISLVSRLGHALFPTTSRGPAREEAATFNALDRDYRHAGAAAR